MSHGGAERQMGYLAREFKKLDYEVKLVKFYPSENSFKTDYEDFGIEPELAECGPSKWARPMYIARIIKLYKPDAVIAYKDGACMGACLAKLFVKFNLIVSERNTTQILSLKEKLKFCLYSLSNHVVANSVSQANFIKKRFRWLRHKTVVITNMLDTDKYLKCNHDSKPSISVLTTARIAEQKNVINYLYALKILKGQSINIHFDWFGYIQEDDYYENIKEIISIHNLQDYITFHPATNDVLSLYDSYTYFCLPSKFEGFPNSLCEAMASGMICVASDVCDNPHILKDQRFLFNPDDPNDIAERIKFALNLTDSEKTDISGNNRNEIILLCSPDSFITKYIQLI